ncbi:glucose-induced degradation protein 8 homolog [Xenia sp. Carnegie-2017]|uniref:glucose-induced degradation protein 8 homolog n=1 Tax=Xenia sp. Carnegie-2017 TaxID=2897299 RepID=UPI001F04A5AF|nr:glucose-induced degradation protein 8 homolog [Xenia sp. Carnegie-2017]
MSDSDKADDVNQEDWHEKVQELRIPRNEMNALIMDYLVTEGFKQAAEKFKLEAKLQSDIPVTGMDERIQIREAVQSGDVFKAMQLTNHFNPEILDSRPQLYFHLQQQRLIELIRDKDIDTAVEFAQTEMSQHGKDRPEFLEELERTMALLAFENAEDSPFGDLLHPSQRHRVASELNAALLEEENLPTKPRLSKIIKLLEWSQKELDKNKVKYPRMTCLATAEIELTK